MPPPGTRSSASRTPAVLALGEGFVVDAIVEARLRRQLRRAGPGVAAVVATRGPLPAGATYRTYAARQTLVDWSAVVVSDEPAVRGAVVVRADVAVEHRDGTILLEPGGGTILRDEGAHVHAPWESGGPIEPAASTARPAFARRPVVVLVGLDVDEARAAWAQTLANELVSMQVAASCAVPVDPGGFQLSRPCAPTRASIEALRPDLVITLDEPAAAVAPDWLDGDRHTVVIEALPDPDLAHELVSWRLGEARGRVRARIGEAIDSGELARLVNRLCSGPQPLPPPVSAPSPATPEDWREGVAAVLGTIRPRRRPLARRFATRSLLVVDGSSGTAGSARLEGFVDQLVAAGCSALRRRLDAPGLDLLPADVVLLGRAAPEPDLLTTIDARRRAGRPTVVDLSLDDVDVRPSAAERSATLGAVAPLVDAAGLVTVPTRALADALDLEAVAVLVLPTLVTERLATVEPLDLEPGIRTVVGWTVDVAPPDELAAVAAALGRLLDERPEVSVEVVGPAADEAVAAVLTEIGPERRGRLMRRSGHPGVEWRRSLLVQLWTGSADAVALGGELGPLVEAGLAAVPTLISATNPATVDAAHPDPLVVAPPSSADAWADALRGAIDEPARTARAQEVLGVAEPLWGREASGLVLNRFLGWLQRSRHGA